MQYKIPQDISREDKLITIAGGGISLRQLIIILVGGGFCYLIFVSLNRYTDPIAYVPPMVIIGILTIAIAFFRRDNLTFFHMIMLLMEAAINPSKRVWTQMGGDISPFTLLENLFQAATPQKGPPDQQAKVDNNPKNISKLVELLDYDQSKQQRITGEIDLSDSAKPERTSWLEKLSQEAAKTAASAIRKPAQVVEDESDKYIRDTKEL